MDWWENGYGLDGIGILRYGGNRKLTFSLSSQRR